ncbi:MAG TPA: alkaline phosphatase family protein, partial [Tepidisphaeraceae bacterium]|nr:alkaline phosphatase family protein [Tepidisphaeraceae bacterium]
MPKRFFASFAAGLLCWTFAAAAQTRSTGAHERPALVLLVAIDQFRYDYLTRFRSEYTGGLKLLVDRGAVFVNANLEHYPTVTAIGHSTMLSGATPATSGIIGNDWYDRASGKRVTSVSDDQTKLLGGGGGRGSSPRRLLVSTVGDELKRSSSAGSKVLGLSLKDRAAILPAGRMADAAYWYSEDTGEFVSSTYFFPEVPGWVREFNNQKLADTFKGKTWLDAANGQKERGIAATIGPKFYSTIYGSPYGNDLLESFAERAMEAEQLGRRGPTDLLSVSFSSNDSIGHTYGPDSPEVHAVAIAVDRTIGRFLSFVDRTVGLNKVLVVLTSDHGVAPGPETLEREKLPGGRLKTKLADPAQQALEARYGAGNWVLDTTGASLYLNNALIADHRLDPG